MAFLQPSNMGWKSISSSTSEPMAGQPKAIAPKPLRAAGCTCSGVSMVTSAPASFMPSATALAMASVLPVPLQ